MGNHDHPSESLRPNELKVMHFLVCALYLTDEKVRNSFSVYLDKRDFDHAIQKLREDNELPDWFKNYFHYDPLYGILDPLRELMSLALTAGLIRLDGTRFNYHLDQVSGRVIMNIIKEENFDRVEVQKFADRMSQIILHPTS